MDSIERLLDRPVFFRLQSRTLLAALHDAIVVGAAWLAAYLLRFNLQLLPAEYPYLDFAQSSLFWIVPLHMVVFVYCGLYRGIWRYASIKDLQRILFAAGLSTLFVATILKLSGLQGVPRSVLLIHPVVLIALMGGSRLAYRAWKEYRLYGHLRFSGEPVLVIGAGDAAMMLLPELERHGSWHVVGLIDDNPAKQGRHIRGVRILGGVDSLAYWAERTLVKQVIIAMPSESVGVRRKATEAASAAGLSVLSVPALADILSDGGVVSRVREVELEDLLGRDPVNLDDAGLHAVLTGKVILVTGAGGSIGSELCRQISAFQPSLLVLLDSNEFAMYQIEQEARELFPDVQIVCAIGDVKNPLRMRHIFSKYAPSVVFHAAAYKHVPMMEDENAWEAVCNNVLGTLVLGRAASAGGVARFVLISTDKAVNPTNVMGATKRLAEMVCQALQQTSQTRFQMVRFGNVLGSTGSVIPRFREQIERGGPVTVTHPEVIRYFMSIPEAAQLVLQAGCMGLGGEIFVLDMGEPVRILDLARDMIRLSGLTEDDVKITFTGLRPGEKLFEELLADNEQTRPTPHPKLRVAKARQVDEAFLAELTKWLYQPRILEDEEVRRDLKRWVPEYTTSVRPNLRQVGGTEARPAVKA